jgi:hypothetical protein
VHQAGPCITRTGAGSADVVCRAAHGVANRKP